MAKPDNVFKEKGVDKADIKRNRFDLSHFNNMTMNMGKFYPNLVIEVLPNDSFTIKTSAGFSAMPMPYPVQTPIYFNQYFFKCRNRAVHKNWKRFITGAPGAENVVPPYLELKVGSEQARKILTTGSLGDYMGIPTINSSLRTQGIWVGLNPRLYIQLSAVPRFFSQTENLSDWALSFPMDNIVFGVNWWSPEWFAYPVFNDGQSEPLGNADSLTGVFQRLFYSSRLIRPTGDPFQPEEMLSVNASNVPQRLQDYRDFVFSSQCGAIYYDQYFGTSIRPDRFLFDINSEPVYGEDSVLFNRLRAFLTGGNLGPNSQYGFTEMIPMNLSSARFLTTGAQLVSYLYYKIGRPDNTSVDRMNAHLRTYQTIFASSHAHVFFVGVNSSRVYAYGLCSLGLDYFMNDPIVDNENFITGRLQLTSNVLSTNQVTSDEPVVAVYSICFPDAVARDSFVLLNQWDVAPLFPLGLCQIPVQNEVSSVLASSPFTTAEDGTAPVIPISALPFRHYESIFNSYFRRQQVDPLMIDGQPEYEDFVRSKEDGADSLIYDFFDRYWESDFLTSCMPSPQQGVAPLVGVTSAGTFTFRADDGTEYTAQAIVGDDGETLSGIDVMSADIPSGSLKELMNYVNHGISINDFRNANCLQLYLENNLRNGYRYRDMMKSQHGITVRFDELDMPEYIGGFSTPVQISKIINSDAQGDVPLGQFAGLGEISGKSSYSSSCFCDEHGFIIGICSITPVPVYSQNLPKFFTKSHFLDYYERHFAKIGYQPVTYREVTPVNRFNEGLADGESSVDDVFGYQKAWYEYMSMTDEAHGDFRNSLRDYIMYRLFARSPELGKDFISVKNDQLNNVFASDDPSDKFVGQVYFDIVAKREILRNVTPGLI